MIGIEMEDVLAVLGLCKPYLIGIIAAILIGAVVVAVCRKMPKSRQFLIWSDATWKRDFRLQNRLSGKK